MICQDPPRSAEILPLDATAADDEFSYANDYGMSSKVWTDLIWYSFLFLFFIFRLLLKPKVWINLIWY